MFDDSLICRVGMEYKAKLPCGGVVHYISKDTAKAYAENKGAQVIGPLHGPFIPECFAKLRGIGA